MRKLETSKDEQDWHQTSSPLTIIPTSRKSVLVSSLSTAHCRFVSTIPTVATTRCEIYQTVRTIVDCRTTLYVYSCNSKEFTARASRRRHHGVKLHFIRCGRLKGENGRGAVHRNLHNAAERGALDPGTTPRLISFSPICPAEISRVLRATGTTKASPRNRATHSQSYSSTPNWMGESVIYSHVE